MRDKVNWRWACLSSLLFLLFPLGPGLFTEQAEMECLKKERFFIRYESMQACEVASQGEAFVGCVCRKASNSWAVLYYLLAVPVAFAVTTFIGLRGTWEIKAATMNAALVVGGAAAYVIAKMSYGTDTAVGTIWLSLTWLSITMVLANGLLLLFYVAILAVVRLLWRNNRAA